jgi:ABC-type transporter Mla maintaining outer membrane lipid asymmetry permease subunit MlaE
MIPKQPYLVLYSHRFLVIKDFTHTEAAIEIGKASTRAVVLSCVMVLFADLILTWLLLR